MRHSLPAFTAFPHTASPGFYTYTPVTAFNGALFKDFAESANWEVYFNFFLVSTKLQSPSFKLYTFSPSTRRTSIFVWIPGAQGTPYASGEWVDQFIGPDSGSEALWPVGPAGGTGWFCSYVTLTLTLYDGGVP